MNFDVYCKKNVLKKKLKKNLALPLTYEQQQELLKIYFSQLDLEANEALVKRHKYLDANFYRHNAYDYNLEIPVSLFFKMVFLNFIMKQLLDTLDDLPDAHIGKGRKVEF